MDPIGKCATHWQTGVKGAEHLDRFDRRARELGCYVVGNAGQTQHVDVQHLPCRERPFEVRAIDVLQAEHEAAAGNRALDRVGVHGELIPDRRPNQVGAIRIEAFLDEKVDLTEVDDAEIDREFLAFADPDTRVWGGIRHLLSIHIPSMWMAIISHSRELRKSGVWIESPTKNDPRGEGTVCKEALPRDRSVATAT